MAMVYFGLGTNLGDKERNLYLAIEKIEERIGKVISQSAFYASEPWGFESANSFLNAVIGVETSLSPFQLLEETQLIEKEIGRNKKSVDGVYNDRLIDIDTLLYNDLILHTEKLDIPHPLMTERLFVMKPLCEIAPELVIPETGKTVQTICDDLSL
ncbi:2-amino-4-hydroxy-6-hydroxymethyldihydropteridine diphosphokinase [uncultured Bacteroides sp.]|uniref:2-amino-4-hydroxy-6- hydroxymethyldihydropteridine diphosphokinase n=1 Tax=uncultured Bacteroides sp. TaxID=162156 RepID=UPI002AA73CE7|nr:2-amino-4-hydroxy-6-hydroxymethyldihydropteridine diphosphokinase [uncultured Bacteroides sp.]